MTGVGEVEVDAGLIESSHCKKECWIKQFSFGRCQLLAETGVPNQNAPRAAMMINSSCPCVRTRWPCSVRWCFTMLYAVVSSVHGDSTGYPQEDEDAEHQHRHRCLCEMDHL